MELNNPEMFLRRESISSDRPFSVSEGRRDNPLTSSGSSSDLSIMMRRDADHLDPKSTRYEVPWEIEEIARYVDMFASIK
jgi:hypothetical protein